jgi:LuxR family transcriptional regulator, maltose regulon positive regulatory protein
VRCPGLDGSRGAIRIPSVPDGIDQRPNQLDPGWADLRAGRWQAARECFSDAVRSQGTPEAFEGLSWAAWWLDDAEAMFEAREQAFRLYRQRGDAASAARMAAWLAADQLDFRGALALAGGWLDRARRLLEPLPVGPDHGWLAFHQGFVASLKGETDAAEKHSLRAAELGRAFGVPDLEMLGLALQGAILVSRARVADGMQCLDEASAIALAGEATIPISGAWTCCFLVTACEAVLDFERAFQWCDRIDEFAQRYGNRYMLGFCRDHYATIHLWRGEWMKAEQALNESIGALLLSRPPAVEGPLTQLAELRRRQARAQECEQLLERAGASSRAQLCRANLALDRDDPVRAVDLAERVLRAAGDARPLDKVPALEVLVRAQIACARLDDAASSVNALAEMAKSVATTALRAIAALSAGMLAAARGEHERAKPLFEDAIDGFDRCRAAFDGARARIELAKTLVVLGRAADARREASAAEQRLRDLGAVLDCERAQRLLGGQGSRGSALPVPVSPREKEVLSLLAKGLTNRAISERLFISEHTVHRHVTSILRKLELPSRAAAAAYAVRAGLGEGREA